MPRGPVVCAPVLSPPVLPPPEPEVFYCDPCEKEFKVESQYKSHLATHVQCQSPGCTFSASLRVVKDHIAAAHGDGGEKKTFVLETPEEIEKWRAERRKNWPSSNNLKRRQEEAAGQAQRGDARANEPRAKRGPNWRIEIDNSSHSKGAQRGAHAKRRGRGGTGGRGGAASGGIAREIDACELDDEEAHAAPAGAGPAEHTPAYAQQAVAKEEKAAAANQEEEEENVAPAPLIEAGLFGCYASSSDDDSKPREAASTGMRP